MLDAIFRFLSKYQYDLTINPETQHEHARRGGFCSLHTWQYENISSPYGVCTACSELAHRIPTPTPAGERRLQLSGLYDVCLSLRMEGRVVGNAIDADGKGLIIITGANQGGKSSFLRSIGLAQLMMQCGMFVGAEAFTAELCPALLTHYKREEDATMTSGKLDEELARMSEIVDHIEPNSMLLFNESFAATNEREGSEIARQIVCALLEKRIKIFYVTHLYEFAHDFFNRKREDAIFLRAERNADGTRTFRLLEGEPLETAFGEDLYRQIFGLDDGTNAASISVQQGVQKTREL